MDSRDATRIEQDDQDTSLLDFALLLAENLRLLLLTPVAAGLAALMLTFLIAPTYTASTRFLVPDEGIPYISVLKGPAVIDPVIQRFDLTERYKVQNLEHARRMLDRRTKISAREHDRVVSLAVEDEDPEKAASIANALVDSLRNVLRTLAITEASHRRLHYEGQLEQIRDALRRSERASRDTAAGRASLQGPEVPIVKNVATLMAEITAQEMKLAALRGFLPDDNPSFRQDVKRLMDLRAELSRMQKNNAANNLGKYGDFRFHQRLFELVAQQHEIARLDEMREDSGVQIIDRAQQPSVKTRPQRALLSLLSSAASFFLALFWVLIRRALKNWAGQPSSAEKLDRLRRLLRTFLGPA